MVGTVKIIHDELKGGAYRFLADFFRLAGIHVRNCVLREDSVECSYDQVILIRDGITAENLANLSRKYPDMITVDEITGDYGKDGLKEYLNGCLGKIRENANAGDQAVLDHDRDALLIIADIYVEHGLMRHRNIFTYFFEFEDIVEASQHGIADAYIDLMERMGKAGFSSKFFIYTQINLARYLDETCKFLGQRFIFDIGGCLSRLDDALKSDHTFYNVFILKAFFAEIDSEYAYRSEAFYNKAAEYLGDCAYMSYPRYRMGRYFERICPDEEKSEENYRKALQLNPCEYRAVYKIIQIEKMEGKYGEAVESCRKICNILHIKEENDYLQPREYEYLFKAYREMELIYGNHLRDPEEYDKAVANKNSVLEKLERPNLMYSLIFGDEAGLMAEKTKERLNTTVARCIR